MTITNSATKTNSVFTLASRCASLFCIAKKGVTLLSSHYMDRDSIILAESSEMRLLLCCYVEAFCFISIAYANLETTLQIAATALAIPMSLLTNYSTSQPGIGF